MELTSTETNALLCFSGILPRVLASHLFPAESIHSVFTRYFCVPDLCCNARQHNQILKYMRPHHTVHYNNTYYYICIYIHDNILYNIIIIYTTHYNNTHWNIHRIYFCILLYSPSLFQRTTNIRRAAGCIGPHPPRPQCCRMGRPGMSWFYWTYLKIWLHCYINDFYPPISWCMFMVHHVPMNLHSFPIERWSSPMTHGPLRPSRAWMSSVPRPIISTVRWMARTCRSSRLPGR